jgi:hypothetical protein
MFFYNTSIMALAKKLPFSSMYLQEDHSLIKPLVRGNTSNFPVEARPLAKTSSSGPHEESVHI